MGYKFQFITLAGFHSLNYSMFKLAHGYARSNMSAFVELQEKEFAAAERGFTAVKHQREVGTGYFDAVTKTIEAQSSTTALKGSTEDEQFFDAEEGRLTAAHSGRRSAKRKAWHSLQSLEKTTWSANCPGRSKRWRLISRLNKGLDLSNRAGNSSLRPVECLFHPPGLGTSSSSDSELDKLRDASDGYELTLGGEPVERAVLVRWVVPA